MNKYKKSFESLQDIYREGSNEKFERGSNLGRIISFIIGLLAIVLLTLATGYYVFREPKLININQGDVSFEIKGNDDVASGEEVIYIVDYKNNYKVDLTNNEIKLSYPEGFIAKMVEPTPSDEKYNIWRFDKLKPGEEGQIKIKGVITGNIGEKKEIKGDFKYNPANTTAYFNKAVSLNVNVSNIYLALNIEGPESFKAGEKNKLKIKYVNNSTETLESLRLIVFYPRDASLFVDGKEVFQSQIQNGENTFAVDIEKIEGKKGNELDADLSLASQATGAKIKSQVGYILPNNDFITQAEDEKEFFVLKGDISAQLMINGKSDQGFINNSEKLNYTLVIMNENNVSAKEIIPKVIIDDTNDLLDWDSLEFREEGNLENREIFWDKEHIEKLAELASNDKVELNFSIALKEKEHLNNIITEPLISWAEIHVAKMGDLENAKDLKSNLVTFSLNTDLEFNAEVRYFSNSGEPIGSGPLPPKLGEETAYKIFWNLKNNLNDAKDILIKAKLPENVRWNEKTEVDSGELYFDQKTRTIIWSVPKLPANLGKSVEANFELSIKPENSDVDKVMILLKGVELVGYDSTTGAKLESNYNFFTTGDEKTSGRGVVTE